MTDRDTLEEDLDRVLSALEPQEPVGEWDWEPPLGSPGPTTPAASAAPLQPEGSDEAQEPDDEPENEPENETDEEQETEDDE